MLRAQIAAHRPQWPRARLPALRGFASLADEEARLTSLLPDARIDEAERAGSFLGRASRGFYLRHPDAPGVQLAEIKLTLSDEAPPPSPFLPLQYGFMHSAKVHEALPPSAIRPLVEHAIAQCPLRPLAVSQLIGMRTWAADALAEPITTSFNKKLRAQFGEEAFEAAEAIALGRPRPGHEVLGQGTFRAAEPVWRKLVERFVRHSGLACDVSLFEEAEYTDMRTQYMGDMSPEGIAESGGSLAILAPGAPLTNKC